MKKTSTCPQKNVLGVKSSVDDEVLVAEETKNKLTLSTNNEQPSTSVLPTAKTEEQNHVNQGNTFQSGLREKPHFSISLLY